MKIVTIKKHPVSFNNGFCNATELGIALGESFTKWYLDNVHFVTNIAIDHEMSLEDLIQIDSSKDPYEVWAHRYVIDEFTLGTGSHALVMGELESDLMGELESDAPTELE